MFTTGSVGLRNKWALRDSLYVYPALELAVVASEIVEEGEESGSPKVKVSGLFP